MIILQTTDLPQETQHLLEARFDVIRLPKEPAEREEVLARNGQDIRGIAGTGKGRVDTALLDRLPNLRIVSSYSAGLDQIDTEECARRGIPVENTSHILAEDVADAALWLLMGAVRRFGEAERFLQRGDWLNGQAPLGLSMRGMKVGILGLGHIGKELARRLEVCGCEIAYHGRSRQPVVHRYHDSLIDLAQWCDVLAVCCPATPETEGLVDRKVFEALGSNGFVVNIARGTVIDEAALALALSERRLSGAGLDVFAQEPHVPASIVQDDRVICLPHVGSATTQTRAAMGEAMIARLAEALT
ncbi:2-hydroxyacid dehydrogenase [Paracoccus sp. (in: a-proteobacteria)]|uniref:2-hydroxyacid dehydrogenase n=1 Tax=Paracoccus sp. TaxID=267 RepID=UPI00396CE64D